MKTFVITVSGKDLSVVIDGITHARRKINQGVTSHYDVHCGKTNSGRIYGKVNIKSYGDYEINVASDDIYIERDRDAIEDGPYCSACQQAPCECSDRERSSTVHDF